MDKSVFIAVDLGATAAPPASDSVRQLLALIEGLPTEHGELDWRLISVSLNSPLCAELRAFTPTGESVSEAQLVGAAQMGFDVLDVVNDNVGHSAPALGRMSLLERNRLKGFIAPLKGRSGHFEVSVRGRREYRITADRAEIALEEIGRLQREAERRPMAPTPELGSVEGQITEATTYYGRPALKLRRHLSDDVVTCVFETESVAEVGSEHTLVEIWGGCRVEISGKLVFGGDGRLVQVQANSMRAIVGGADVFRLLREAKERGEVAASPSDWGGDG